jgi:hypothetical protein
MSQGSIAERLTAWTPEQWTKSQKRAREDVAHRRSFIVEAVLSRVDGPEAPKDFSNVAHQARMAQAWAMDPVGFVKMLESEARIIRSIEQGYRWGESLRRKARAAGAELRKKRRQLLEDFEPDSEH